MPNYTKKRNKNDRIRKTFRNIIGGVKNNKGPYNNGKSYLTNRSPYGSYWPVEEVERPSIMKRLTTTFKRFNPFSRQIPAVEIEVPYIPRGPGLRRRRRSQRLLERSRKLRESEKK